MLVSGGLDGKINFWNTHTDMNRLILSLPGHQDGVICLSQSTFNNKTVIISGGYDNIVKVWNPIDANSKLVTSFIGHESWVNSVTSSKLHKKEVAVSAGNDNKIKVWNILCSEKLLKAWNPVGIGSKKLLMTLTGHVDSVTSVITANWSELGNNKEFIISGSKDGTIKIWDPEAELTKVVCSFKIKNGPVKCLSDYVYNGEVAIVSGSLTSIDIWKKSSPEFKEG